MKQKSLYGLVLVGGKSSRMKKDKAWLDFHGKPQVQYAYELLSEFCEKTFVSCREDQKDSFKAWPQIHDNTAYLDLGPLSGILSAMTLHQKASWIVLACDLPFVDQKIIEYLIENRNPKEFATAYQSSNDQLPEPLCAIYESHSLEALKAHLNSKHTCPRKFMINAKIPLLKQLDNKSLNNINNPAELEEAIKGKK